MTALKEKILHITWQMSIGGLERAVYQLIRAQRNIGIEADLMVLSSSSFYGEMVQKSGARVYELGQKSGLDLSIKKKFLQAIESYTLLHFHTASPILMHIACSANCKLYYTHRGGWHPLSLKRLLMYKITGYYLKKHFCVSANTRHAASIASRLYNIAREQIYTTYNGIDFALLQPRQVKKRCKDKVYIGTSANLRSWKRIDYLLQAIAKIKSVPIKCYIIGDGSQKKNLEQLARVLKIEELVTFTGKVDHIGDYLQILDIFVLPSNSGESFGNSAVEAMGMGIPTIVMNDGGGLLEHITENGGLIVKDIEQLSKSIEKLAKNKSMCQNMGSLGKKYITAKYSIDNMLKGYQNFYEQENEFSTNNYL